MRKSISFYLNFAGGSKIQNFQELLLLTLPFDFLWASFLYISCFIHSPESPQFLYSLFLHSSYDNGVTVLICVIVDYFVFIFWVFTYNFGLASNLLFVQTCESTLNDKIQLIR